LPQFCQSASNSRAPRARNTVVKVDDPPLGQANAQLASDQGHEACAMAFDPAGELKLKQNRPDCAR
jgi:hypothetical protein